MTGTWRVFNVGEEKDHDHIYLSFENGLRLAYRDPRRFGVLDFVAVNSDLRHPRLRHLGFEPLKPELTGESLWQKLRGKKTTIKVAIMDQKIVVGVGNIYASEALFDARIIPTLPSAKVSRQRCEVLVAAIKKILQEAIAAGGSSISDYQQLSGEAGDFQNRFKVYDRAGEACRACGTRIRAKKIGGRSTYWCSTCQK